MVIGQLADAGKRPADKTENVLERFIQRGFGVLPPPMIAIHQ
jgi:hypothetical protein